MMRLLLMIMLTMPMSLVSASVEWGSFSLSDVETGTIAIGYAGNAVYANTSVQIRATHNGEILTLSEEGTYLASLTAWTVAVAGEIINADMLRDLNRLFYRNDDIQANNPFDVCYATDYFYLAFETLVWKDSDMSGMPQTQYGWVSVDVVNGKLNIRDSVIGLAGQSLVVGAGEIPEPTTGMLMVLGIAAIALRRIRSVGGWM